MPGLSRRSFHFQPIETNKLPAGAATAYISLSPATRIIWNHVELLEDVQSVLVSPCKSNLSPAHMWHLQYPFVTSLLLVIILFFSYMLEVERNVGIGMIPILKG